jgi:glycosyltransferase involved in cell wall biosynthesis
MSEDGLFCSLVVPCYNEEGNIPVLASGFAALDGWGELILVDNGSSDGTGAAVAAAAERFPFVRAVSVSPNAGYGGGIKAGLAAAAGEYVGWTHADLQYDPAETAALLAGLRGSAGGKFLFKGLRRGRPPADRFFTAAMSLVVSILFGRRMTDINAQPTLFHRSLLPAFAAAPDDFSLDLFVFAAALRAGFRIERAPVRLLPRAAGRSSWNRGLGSRLALSARTAAAAVRIRRGEGG